MLVRPAGACYDDRRRPSSVKRKQELTRFLIAATYHRITEQRHGPTERLARESKQSPVDRVEWGREKRPEKRRNGGLAMGSGWQRSVSRQGHPKIAQRFIAG